MNTIKLISDDEIFLEQVADEAFKKIAHHEDSRALILEYSKLSRLSLAIQRRIIRRALESVKGNLKEIEFKHVDLILSQMEQGGSAQIDLPGEIAVLNEYGNLVFVLREDFDRKPQSEISEIELKIPGVTNIPSLGIDISAKLEDPKKVDIGMNQKREKAYLDFDKIELPLRVRTRFPGDRFIPLGMSNEKKIQDFFVDKKISKRKRDKIPIIESQGQIVWIGKMVIDDRVKVTRNTEKVLVLEVK